MSDPKTGINDIIEDRSSMGSGSYRSISENKMRTLSLITGDNPCIDNAQTQPPSGTKSSEDSKTIPIERRSVPQLVSIIESDDIYAGKDVSLVFEGDQEVFYRGDYVTRIQLTGEPLLIGRRDVMAGHYPDIDLAMYWKQDRSISRRHLRIYRDSNGSWYVEDICRNNSTFINSLMNPLNGERVELKHGDRILISNSIAITFTVR